MTRMRLQSAARDELPFPDVAVHAEPGGQRLVFQTLGAVRLILGDDRIVPSTGTLFALLVRVAYSPEFRQPRDELLTSLWPGQSSARQRGNLRQTLYKARSMGINVMLVGECVCLDPRQVVSTFSLAQTTALFDRDVIRGSEPFGVFLPSFVAPWPDFQEWVDAQRATVHAAVRRVLVELLRVRRERADWSGAEALARWLLQFDPLNEEATLTLAECTMLAGSKAEAVAIIDRYLAEIGPSAGDIRLPATLLRKRFTEPPSKKRPSLVPTERHFVGRTRELANLTMAMRRARWHDGSAVMIHGPAGMGKTRLTRELAKVATIEGFRAIQATCRATECTRNLGPFLDLTPDLLLEKGALGCSPESLRTLRQIRQASPIDDRDDTTSQASGVDPSHARWGDPLPTSRAIRVGFIDLLLAISYERPTLLIIDDAQWLDEGSWELLVDLIERLESARVFCAITSRTSSPRADSSGYPPPRIESIPLHPLAQDECVQLANALASDFSAVLSNELAIWFAGACEGGPLYLHALVSHWIETGEAGGVPPTLQAVLDQRLSQLSNDALRVLQTIALLDKLATPQLVKEILELETFRLLDAIEELSRANAMRDTEATIEAHQLLSKCALSKLSATSTLALRRRIGGLSQVSLDFE
jgi:DNA-binding SARP family transcriptional activator